MPVIDITRYPENVLRHSPLQPLAQSIAEKDRNGVQAERQRQ
jgi:hypothetical protein